MPTNCRLRPDERGIDRAGRRTDTSREVTIMRRIRIERSTQRHKDDRLPVLPIDPRDPDIVRAKQVDRPTGRVKSRI
jgi:hypothetical protein